MKKAANVKPLQSKAVAVLMVFLAGVGLEAGCGDLVASEESLARPTNGASASASRREIGALDPLNMFMDEQGGVGVIPCWLKGEKFGYKIVQSDSHEVRSVSGNYKLYRNGFLDVSRGQPAGARDTIRELLVSTATQLLGQDRGVIRRDIDAPKQEAANRAFEEYERPYPNPDHFDSVIVDSFVSEVANAPSSALVRGPVNLEADARTTGPHSVMIAIAVGPDESACTDGSCSEGVLILLSFLSDKPRDEQGRAQESSNVPVNALALQNFTDAWREGLRSELNKIKDDALARRSIRCMF